MARDASLVRAVVKGDELTLLWADRLQRLEVHESRLDFILVLV